jgi:hypothetical protein
MSSSLNSPRLFGLVVMTQRNGRLSLFSNHTAMNVMGLRCPRSHASGRNFSSTGNPAKV